MDVPLSTYNPEYLIEAYASWFLQNWPWPPARKGKPTPRRGSITEWCARIRPKWHKFPMISISWRPYLTPTYIPEEPLICNPAWYHICCGYFFLDSQGEFLYSPSQKKQVPINSINMRQTTSLYQIYGITSSTSCMCCKMPLSRRLPPLWFLIQRHLTLWPF
jgi:hypothetical protein